MGEHTPVRTIRVDPALWEAAQAVAALRGETVSSVIRAALVRYVKRHTS
jgi:predicted transcriptional regulator